MVYSGWSDLCAKISFQRPGSLILQVLFTCFTVSKIQSNKQVSKVQRNIQCNISYSSLRWSQIVKWLWYAFKRGNPDKSVCTPSEKGVYSKRKVIYSKRNEFAPRPRPRHHREQIIFFQSKRLFITKTSLYNFDPPFIPLLYYKTGVYRGIHYFSYFCSKNIECEFLLEPPRWGGSNEDPHSVLWAEFRKISELFIWKFSFFGV